MTVHHSAHLITTLCHNCAHYIWFVRCPDTTWEIHHYGCATPTYHVRYCYPAHCARLDSIR